MALVLGGAPAVRAAGLEPVAQLAASQPTVFGEVAAEGPIIGAAVGATVDVFAKPPTGWSDAGPSAELVDPDAPSPFITSLAVSPSLVVVTYVDDLVDVYDEPVSGWAGEIAPAARLTDSSSTPSDPVSPGPAELVGDSVLLSEEAGIGASASGGPGAWVDVFDRPASGWSGDLTENARLEDSHGANTHLDSSQANEVLATADPAHGNARADVFRGPIDQWRGIVGQSATLNLAADSLHSRARASNPVIIDDGLVFAEPARGWTGVIQPVGALRAIGAPLFEGSLSRSGDVALYWGCQSPVGSPDSGCQYGEWLFDPPHGLWQGVIAAPLAASDRWGDAASSPPSAVLLDDSTIAVPDYAGTISVDHIARVSARRCVAPAPAVTVSPVAGVTTGVPWFSVWIRTQRQAPNGGSATLQLPAGLSFTADAQRSIAGSASQRMTIHGDRLTFSFGPGSRIDLDPGALRASRHLRDQARHAHSTRVGQLRVTLQYAFTTVRRTPTLRIAR